MSMNSVKLFYFKDVANLLSIITFMDTIALFVQYILALDTSYFQTFVRFNRNNFPI